MQPRFGDLVGEFNPDANVTRPSEAQLIERVRGGDQAALGQLLQSHQQRLFNVALRMVGNRDDAAEVTQDALVKIVEHIGRFRGEAQFGTWSTRIVMNQATSHLRKRNVRKSVSLDGQSNPGSTANEESPPLGRQLADDMEPGPLQRVQSHEMRQHLEQALERLDEDFRAVIVLRDISEMDYQQIARTLDLAVGTVKSRLFRARLALREELAKLDQKRTSTKS